MTLPLSTCYPLYLLLLKSVEFDDDVALLLSDAGLVMGPHVTSESEIGSTDSAALRSDIFKAWWMEYLNRVCCKFTGEYVSEKFLKIG